MEKHREQRHRQKQREETQKNKIKKMDATARRVTGEEYLQQQ
jgi:hypothetical protein